MSVSIRVQASLFVRGRQFVGPNGQIGMLFKATMKNLSPQLCQQFAGESFCSSNSELKQKDRREQTLTGNPLHYSNIWRQEIVLGPNGTDSVYWSSQ